jgi:hypothetical protein
VQRKGGLIAVKSRISGKEAIYVARESERRRPVKLLASDRLHGGLSPGAPRGQIEAARTLMWPRPRWLRAGKTLCVRFRWQSC